ncbi:hypothetical protein V6N13_074612 [Hibiscus sabdariffa]
MDHMKPCFCWVGLLLGLSGVGLGRERPAPQWLEPKLSRWNPRRPLSRCCRNAILVNLYGCHRSQLATPPPPPSCPSSSLLYSTSFSFGCLMFGLLVAVSEWRLMSSVG